MLGFKTVNVKSLNENVFKLFDEEWCLITSGSIDSFNTMTASWGMMGILWNRPVAICFIRPQRYTNQFVEKSEYYTLSFFEEKHRDILNFCGSNSGRDCNKVKETGLIPVFSDMGNIGYQQARMIFECKKLYSDNLKSEGFLDQYIIKNNYPISDFHYFYIGEIVGCYIKEGN